MSVPLQVLDDFLLNYNVGQVLVLTFVLVMLGSLPLKSRRILAVNCLLFGVILIATPVSLSSLTFKFLGIVLVMVGPLLYFTGSE